MTRALTVLYSMRDRNLQNQTRAFGGVDHLPHTAWTFGKILRRLFPCACVIRSKMSNSQTPLHRARQRFPFLSSLLLLNLAAALLAPLAIAQSGTNPPRWQVQYTQLYTEGMAVGPGTGILLGNGASLVTDP